MKLKLIFAACLAVMMGVAMSEEMLSACDQECLEKYEKCLDSGSNTQSACFLEYARCGKKCISKS